MLRKLIAVVAALLLGTPAFAGTETPAPFKDAGINRIYAMLFCDDLKAFRSEGTTPRDPPWSVLFGDSTDVAAVQAIADDPKEESRLRALAFNWLRQHKASVSAKIVLGVVVEVANGDGLDVLAAYADGRVRYINHTETLGVFEGVPAEVADNARKLVAAAEPAVKTIGPWDKARLPAPVEGHVRLSFVVSDGLYFGEATMDDIAADPLSGPVFSRAMELLVSVVRASQEQQ